MKKKTVNGTDHGWGGNTMIMGENIHGGQVLGEYPSWLWVVNWKSVMAS